jgi:dUTP pyrophosphatase
MPAKSVTKNPSNPKSPHDRQGAKMIYFKQLHENATLPTRGSAHAAGLDLYAVERMDIRPGAQAMIPTGLSVAIPSGHYGRIAPRSGLAAKHGIQVHAGVVDSDYRGEMRVCLINHGSEMVEFKPGDRIAQLIIERCLITPAAWADDLDSTERGQGGFGSTGV